MATLGVSWSRVKTIKMIIVIDKISRGAERLRPELSQS
ncbi:hypothetical protein HRUBRA_02216 [Pseudohaliea rubra DSM 19751]|uniref:Uncharacterized protein n=1 Tax=Pseudohaliea rubra DSM 19751 TaxID=1265313 RepID=A0A095XU39_9GAMM|nr:hypothetical protein HRUBRA_02216 [Pseudohaliea rubra DSM 19751]